MGQCDRAIAYLKASLPEEDKSSDVVLSHDDSPVLKDLGDSLLVAYLVDDRDRFTYVQHRDLRREAWSESQLHESAIGRLRGIAQGSLEVRAVGNGIFAALVGGHFEASLILLDALWETGLRHLLQHDFVVCVPARDVLAFCDSATPGGLQELRRVVERVWPRGDHLLTKSLYRRREGRWRKLP